MGRDGAVIEAVKRERVTVKERKLEKGLAEQKRLGKRDNVVATRWGK